MSAEPVSVSVPHPADERDGDALTGLLTAAVIGPDHTIAALTGFRALALTGSTGSTDGLTQADRLALITTLEGVQAAAWAAQARVAVDFAAEQRREQLAAGISSRNAGRAAADDLATARKESPFRASNDLAAARTATYAADPQAYVNRGRRAARDRYVSLRPAPDVMSMLSAYLPVASGVACHKVLKGDSDDEPAPRWVRPLTTDDATPGGSLTGRGTRRAFTGALRAFIVTRDKVCTTPWCGAPIRHVDHTIPWREGGPTTADNGRGTCARCNLHKELPRDLPPLAPLPPPRLIPGRPPAPPATPPPVTPTRVLPYRAAPDNVIPLRVRRQ